MKTLEGKVVAVTGAGSGIGRALAIELANLGCKLSLAEINKTALKETSDLLPETCEYITHIVDVSQRNQVEEFAHNTATHFGAVDVVINNAGVSLSQSISNSSIEEMEWLININLWGVIYGCKAFLPFLMQRPEAHIVNTSSVFGLMTAPNQAAYNASKFAVRGFTESLSQETRNTPIHVSCVYPGGIKTNIVRNGRFHINSANITSQNEAANSFEEMATTSPKRAAQVIINGILNKRKRIMIGSDSRFIDFIVRLLPASYEYLLSKKQDNSELHTSENNNATAG